MNKPPSPASNAVVEKKTIVEDGTALKGSITSTCAILVQGSIDGEVTGPDVEIAATGSVAGKITTTNLNSKGTIAGELDVESAKLAGTVAHNTVVRTSKLDVKLSSTNPTKKLELRFKTGSDDKLS